MSPTLKPLLVTDLEGLLLCVAFLERTAVFGFDIETNVTNNFTDRYIRTIQIGDRDEQFVIDLLAFTGSKDALMAAQGPIATNDLLKPVFNALRPHLEDHSRIKVGANLQFEYENLRYRADTRCTGFFDIWRAEQQLYAGLVHFMTTGFWALENIVARYTGLAMQDVVTGKTFDLETPLTETQVIYAALDVRLPMAARQGQLKKIAEAGLEASCQIDFDAISPFGDAHLNGVQTDDAQFQAIIDENLRRKGLILSKLDEKFIPVCGTKHISAQDVTRLNELERAWATTPQKTPEDKAERAVCRKAFMVFRHDLNERRKIADKCDGEAAVPFGSPQKLLAAFRKLGYGEKKMPSTGDEILEKLAKFPNLKPEKAFEAGDDLSYPVIDLMRLYRSVDKLCSTYGSAWIKTWNDAVGDGHGHRNPVTGRIHSNLDLFGTSTGRTSSNKPNIQNLPKLKKYRRCFTARPGFKVLTIDYSGCELRILTEMSHEPVWLKAFLQDWDVHSVGAEILFGQEWIAGAEEGCVYVAAHKKCDCKVHDELRGRVKAINFGLAYGLSASGLSKQLNITFEAAEQLLARYKAAFPTVMAFLDELGKSAKTRLETRTIIGTRRRWAKPTWEMAQQRAADDRKDKTKPITDKDVRWKYTGMFGSIEREGKNAPIQGTNSNLTKLAMYLAWKDKGLEKFGALWLNEVHDELVVEVPEANAQACYAFVGSCMTEAGAIWIKSLPMTWEGHIEDYWTK